jgi:FeS assembly SUF system protein
MAENEQTNNLRDKIIEKIKTVFDPEIPVNIWELGLVYDIQITAENDVVVLMTLTAPNCPEAEQIPVNVENAIKMLHDVNKVKVIITFDPPWERSMMSDAAKLELGFF